MQCIKCGKPVPDGEIFCALCSLSPERGKKPMSQKSVDTKKKPKANRQKKTLADSLNPPVPHKAYATAEPKRRNFFPAFLVALLLAVAAVSYIATTYHEWNQWTTVFESQEAELLTYQSKITTLEQALADATTKLASTEESLSNAETSLATLQAQLGITENTATQTQYDMTTQQMEMSDLETENQQLTTELASTNVQVTTLTGQVEDLVQGMEDMTSLYLQAEAAAAFMNQHVVFVSDDGTNTYHLYGCEQFTIDSFWAYNRSLAESNGNTPCPICFPEG